MESNYNPILKHNETGTVIVINHDPFIIGRALCCHYVIASPTISRKHCALTKVQNNWCIKNLSQNGSFLNGAHIKENTILHHADVITLAPNEHSYVFLKPVPTVIDDGKTTCTELESLFEDELDPVPVLEEPLRCDKDKAVKNISQKNSNVHSVPSTSTTEKYSSPDSPERKKLKTSNELKCDLDSCDKDSLQSDIVALAEDINSELKEIETNKKVNMKDTNEEMESEILCSICSELFIKATTLNCSHTFCAYCIQTWKRTRNICPICRAKITSLNATIVLDNLIEKIIQNGSEQIKIHRQELLEERKKIEETTANNCRGRGARRGYGRGRGNLQSSRGRNNRPTSYVLQPTVIELETSSDSENSSSDTDESDDDDDDDEDDDQDNWEPGIPGTYYGGYGHCYSCGRRGHWANGCQYR